MAYTVTMEFTRPNEETAMVTMASVSGGEDANNTTKPMLEGVGLTKTFEVDGLVTKVIYTAADKDTWQAAKDNLVAATGTTVNPATGVPTAYKAACQAAGITCHIYDSDGVTINNW